MKFKSLHPGFKLPTKGSALAGAFDLYMPEGGFIDFGQSEGKQINLGFAAEVPEGYVALILPRSGTGGKHGLSLNNTCGVVDADYRGEWFCYGRMRNHSLFRWQQGDRLFQMLLVPVLSPELELVSELSLTNRGTGGFGSTGQ